VIGFLGLLFLLFFTSVGVAQETPPALQKLVEESGPLLPQIYARTGPTLTLSECYEIALEKHPVLFAQRAAVDQAAAQAEVAWAQFDPTVGANINRTWLTVTPFYTPGPVISNQTQAALNVTQVITDWGQRKAAAESAEWALKAAFYAFQSSRLEQFQRVQFAYLEVLRAELFLAIQNENLSRTRFMQEFANKLYKAGQKSMIDVSQATTQTAQAEVNTHEAENSVQNSRLALAQAVGMDSQGLEDRPLQLLLEDPFAAQSRDEALLHLENNPVLLSLEAQARAFEKQAEQQRRTRYPVLSSGVQYGLQGLNGPDAQFWQFGLSLSMPLYLPGVEAQARQFEANAAQLRFNKDNARLQLLQQLDTAYSDLKWTDKRAHAGKREVELALANLALSYKRYRAGLADITEQINAREFVNSAQNDYARALVDRKLAEGRLLQVLGQLPLAPAYDPENPQIPLPALEKD